MTAELVQVKEETIRSSDRSEVVVSVKNVSKKFCKTLKRSMAYGIAELSKNLMGVKPDSTELRKDEFWAVDDVSFELRRGEILGLIGVNGSGKSTLLRLLAGIFPPDKGEITIRGRVGALISLGSGFHPHMTGRENIYLNGTILGMKRDEIDSKFHDIVEFAEIPDFLDAPVSTYSSGMRVRLGFAIAAQMEPDVLLIDEVLAVGDVGFRAKCFNAIAKISTKAAIVIVSHHMPHVARVSTDLIVLNRGRIKYYGSDVPKGIEKYYSFFQGEKNVVTGSGEAELLELDFESNGVKPVKSINYLDDLTIYMKFKVNKSIKHPIIYVTFLNQSLQGIAHCNSKIDNVMIHNETGLIQLKIVIPKINLNPGIHFVSVGVQSDNPFRILKQYFAHKELRVLGNFISIASTQLKGDWIVN
jgi:lipopolysaccharide transport system ATP-binding protein